jgi:hypothetical protein
MSLRKHPQQTNPKLAPDPPSHMAEDGEWGSGNDPMTPAQASHLKALSEQALEPRAYDETITRAEAAKRIKALTAKLRLLDGPPHTA